MALLDYTTCSVDIIYALACIGDKTSGRWECGEYVHDNIA